jgi:hypothetical protein
MHQRRTIREAIADRLKDRVEALGDRVFKSREAPANVMSLLEEGPMANIYARRDHIKPEDQPKSGEDEGVRRTLELAIEVTAVGSAAVDDKLDDLTDEIEALLEGFEIPGLPSAEIRLLSTDIDSTDEFEAPLGGALMEYEIRYWRPFRVPTDDVPTPCGGTLGVIINGGPREVIAGCEVCD